MGLNYRKAITESLGYVLESGLSDPLEAAWLFTAGYVEIHDPALAKSIRSAIAEIREKMANNHNKIKGP